MRLNILGNSDHVVFAYDVWTMNPEPARLAVPQRRFTAINSELLMRFASDIDRSALGRCIQSTSGFSLEMSFASLPTQSFSFGAKFKMAIANLG